MSKQARAIVVAEAIQDRSDWYEFDPSAWCPEASIYLRQQHALIGELVEALGEMLSGAYHDVPAVRARRAKAYAAISKAKEQQ